MAYPAFVENGGSIIARIRRPYLRPSPTFGYSSPHTRSDTLSPRGRAVIFVDQAGWHTTGKLVIPPNISLLLLPPRSPELNPVENIWQFKRDN
jgi:hypothetical protein